MGLLPVQTGAVFLCFSCHRRPHTCFPGPAVAELIEDCIQGSAGKRPTAEQCVRRLQLVLGEACMVSLDSESDGDRDMTGGSIMPPWLPAVGSSSRSELSQAPSAMPDNPFRIGSVPAFPAVVRNCKR